MANLADYVEWGGAAYAPPGSPLPPMGSGNIILKRVEYDGHMCRMQLFNYKGQVMDANHIEPYSDDSSLYSILISSHRGGVWRRVMIYGGPGQRKVE